MYCAPAKTSKAAALCVAQRHTDMQEYLRLVRSGTKWTRHRSRTDSTPTRKNSKGAQHNRYTSKNILLTGKSPKNSSARPTLGGEITDVGKRRK
ncbi:hypothetical protein FQN60_005862 [Etheostoma spectabile]|uniref:Uncharacterized protein n=1 Tax=Etheostoma spectabile TaxID=54343 RepID=A0A5J5CEX9_9PERO|nr:hypothetical protein FQN60_005862 [Etheostoma spectabile]